MVAEPAYVPDMSPATLMTADELLHTSIPDKHVELVRGVLSVREPSGFRHGRVTTDLFIRLSDHVRATGIGHVFAAELGYKLESDPDTVRAPDVSFIAQERLPDPDLLGYPALAPDLVVEVLSPRNRPGETLAKVADWLSAGTGLVWVIDPDRRQARVYRQDGTEALVTGDQALDGEVVVPGFSCPLAAIL
jgi:Uma2 family endonuclease